MPFLRLLRFHQWVKNLLVFTPLLFLPFHQALSSLSSMAIAFLLFSAISSCVYIFNDLKDIESDQKHPKKSRRPLASGAISPMVGKLTLMTLLASSFGFCFYHFSLHHPLIWILLSYILINIAYTFKLKNIAFLDISCIASGFVLRTLAGFSVAMLGQIQHYNLFYLAIFFCALSLSLFKRLIEQQNSPSTRKSLSFFTAQSIQGLSLFFSLLTFSLFTLFLFSNYGTDSFKVFSLIPFSVCYALLYNDALRGLGEDLSHHILKTPIYPILAFLGIALFVQPF